LEDLTVGIIVILGLAFAVLAMFAVFLVMFIDVAFKPPQASLIRRNVNPADLQSPSPVSSDVLRWREPTAKTTTVVVTNLSQPVPNELHAEPSPSMNLRLLFSRHARHLRIVASLLLAAAIAGMFVGNKLVPEAFGDRDPYRPAALQQIASQPSVLSSDATCLKCHSKVQGERAESPHQSAGCMHCHGNGHEHIAAALKAAESPGSEIPKAAEWDGDFRSKQDFFVTKDRATCLSCHASVVGMPSNFRSIDMAKHLEEQGAENVNDKNVCFESHSGHSPGI